MRAESIKAADVRAALVQYLDECKKAGTEPGNEVYEFERELDKQLNVSYEGLHRWDVRKAQDKFRGQVTRALNAAAVAGVLVKASSRRDVCFYTPEKAAVLAQEKAKREEHAAQRDKRFARIVNDLAAMNVGAQRSRSYPEMALVTFDDMERLIQLTAKPFAG